MFSVTSTIFIFIGVGLILLGVLQRWVFVGWYREMSEWSWFFLGSTVPYIDNPDGRAEFAKTISGVFLVEGAIHVVAGVILLPFPDFPLLFVVWFVLILVITLVQRGAFIEVAMEINRKYAQPRVSSKKACPKCGREMLVDRLIIDGAPQDRWLCPKCKTYHTRDELESTYVGIKEENMPA